ncbi:MAG: hypothetical protein CMM02_09310 [Rhodopirellula sp.]|nr:hypothetical protein [Rhodopirellula sp.]|tara:strand:- start:2042 stop:2230 length:189 start_codon:yes stop_codon:yes gene_type:complete
MISRLQGTDAISQGIANPIAPEMKVGILCPPGIHLHFGSFFMRETYNIGETSVFKTNICKLV